MKVVSERQKQIGANHTDFNNETLGVQRVLPADSIDGLRKQIEKFEGRANYFSQVANQLDGLPHGYGSSIFYSPASDRTGTHFQSLFGNIRYAIRPGTVQAPVERLAYLTLGGVADIIHAAGFIFDQPRYWYKRIKQDPAQAALEMNGKIANRAKTEEESEAMRHVLLESLRERVELFDASAEHLKKHMLSKYGVDYDKAKSEDPKVRAAAEEEARKKRDAVAWTERLAGPLVTAAIPDHAPATRETSAEILQLLDRHGENLARSTVRPSSIDPALIVFDAILMRPEEYGFSSRAEAVNQLKRDIENTHAAWREVKQATEEVPATPVQVRK